MTSDQSPLPAALPLAQACQIIGSRQGARPPRVLHQFWDRDPPRQIRTLLAHCGKVCRAAEIEHRVWDSVSADALMADGFPDIVVQAYETAPHPSMQSDILRLAILHRHGGVYLDADMALRKVTGPDLWLSFTDALIFKWNLLDRHNSPTWCLGFRAGHDLARACLMHMSTRMAAAVASDAEKALKHAVAYGPGALTQAIGGWIAARGSEGITVLDVAEAYRMVQNGPELLKAPLDYKKTALHWLVAGRTGR
jgi:hypothetical protein